LWGDRREPTFESEMALRIHPEGLAPIERRARFDELRYAMCWEDGDLAALALAPLPGARVLCIASGGEVALSLLARGAEVLAIDLSTAQLALVELKLSACETLDPDRLLGFLGARSDVGRIATYAGLRERLSPGARGFWDARLPLVARGVLHAGKLERYFELFRRFLLPLVHSRATVQAQLAPLPPGARAVRFERHWASARWRLLARLFLSRAALGRLGRDPAFFDAVEGPVAGRLLGRAEAALCADEASANPYLAWILTGSFGGALPDALQPQHLLALRTARPRLTLRRTALEDALAATPAGSLDACYLSDVPEYLDVAGHGRLLAAALRACRPGARIVYWNLLARRERPEGLAGALEPDLALARSLHARARAFFYDRLVVERVRS
jgi:S-adenosylmethionine-diacylglycerol 3-amino-3-carboxypropyl transferase